jgi:hypothetical protein
VILGATTVAILAGLALRFVAAFLRELGDSRRWRPPDGIYR